MYLMKKIFLYFMAAVAVAALATGCSTVKRTFRSITGSGEDAVSVNPEAQLPQQTGAEIPARDLTALQTETLINSVIYGKWTVADAGGKEVAPAADGEERPYVTFDSTATNPFILKVYAFTGCNTLNGRVALTSEGRLAKMGEFASTLRMCPDAQAEPAIINAFNTVARYRIEHIAGSYILYFYNAEGANTMVLRKSDMGFIDGAWNVDRINPIDIKPDDMPEPMRLVFDMTEGRLHGNTGCNVLNATLATNINVRNSLTITNPATTRMACPNAGLEQQLVNALAKVAKAEKGRRGTVNLLDAAGNTVITLSPANLDPSAEE